jgi:hypothetical protein
MESIGLRKWKAGLAGCLLAGSLFWGMGCAKPEPDLLLGSWKVFHIDRGGMVIAGPSFKGTEYTFRDNGTVFAQNHNGDTITSGYRHVADSLTYINLASRAEERYHLDSLGPTLLQISAEIEAIPTVIQMSRVKK